MKNKFFKGFHLLVLGVIMVNTLFFIGCKNKWDRDKWNKGNKSSNENPRLEMVNDLQENYLRKGKTKINNVSNLLGPPFYNNLDSNKKEQEYKYQLGSNQGLNIDEWWLNLTFDSTGILKEVEVAKH